MSEVGTVPSLNAGEAQAARVQISKSNIFSALGFTSRHTLVRFVFILMYCLAPLALAILMLPSPYSDFELPLHRILPNWHFQSNYSPVFGLVACVVASVGAVIMNRGWSRNESMRQSYVLAHVGTAPDLLPSLLPSAALSGFCIFTVAPLLMLYLNLASGTFFGTWLFQNTGHDLRPWLMLGVDRFVQASTVAAPWYIFGFHGFSQIEPVGLLGRLIVAVIQVLLQLFAFGVLWEIARIFGTLRAAVSDLKSRGESLSTAQNLAIGRLGSRALPFLYRAIQKNEEYTGEGRRDQFPRNAALVLEAIGNRTSITPLIRIFNEPGTGRLWTRFRALRALRVIGERLQGAPGGIGQRFLNRIATMRLRMWVLFKHGREQTRPDATQSKSVREELDALFLAMWGAN